MENPERAERIKAIRVVLGSELSDMDIIRALHLAKNDINQAINIIFDTPSFQNRDKFNIKRTTPGGGARVSITANHVSSSNLMELTMGSPSMTKEIVPYGHGQSTSGNEARVPLSLKQAPVTALVPIKESQLTAKDKFNAIEVIGDAESDDSATSPPALESNTLKEVSCSFDDKGGGGFQTHEIEDEWWFVGCTEVIGFSTCKGRRLNRGDAVTFSFPIPRSAVKKRWGGGRAAAACSEIVRFSTKQYGEVRSFLLRAS
jgi:hypothetical protein